MTMTRSRAQVGAASLLILSSILTACGGGGGGGDSGPAVTQPVDNTGAPSTASRVTEANAAHIASITVNSANFGTGALGVSGLVPNDANPSQFDSTTRALTNFEMPCSAGNLGGNGSISVVLDDADNNSVASAGDSVTMTFNQCRFPNDPETTDGTIVYDLTLLSGDLSGGGAYALGGTMSFSNFGVTSPVARESATMNGQLTFNANSPDGVVETGTATFSDLTVTIDGADSARLQNFVVDFTNDYATNTTTTRQNGNVVYSGVGTLTVSQQVPWVSLMDADYPMSGSIKITAADNSSVVVTALSGGLARLDIDTDGNNTIDRTITDSWENLAQI